MKLSFEDHFHAVPWWFFYPSLKSLILYGLECGICKQLSCVSQEYHVRVDIKDLQVYSYFWQTYLASY